MEHSRQFRFLIITIIILVILNIGTLALLWQNNELGFGKGQRPLHPEPTRNGEDYLKQELNLSASQVASFHQLRAAHFEAMKAISQRERKEMETFFDAMTGVDSNEIAAHAAAERVGDLRTEREMTLYAHFQDLKSVCDEKQQERLSEIFHDFMRKNKPKHPPRKGDGERPRPHG